MTRKQQLKWWQEARFGLFIHWGIYSIPGRGEWVMYSERIPVDEYEKLASQFNPARFNADEWVRIAKDAGMKYIVITAKHHDGFSMFKTDVSPFNIVDATPFGRDVLAELAGACRRADMKLGFYYSHVREWRDPRAQSFESQGRPDQWGNYGNFWDYPNENLKDLQEYIDCFDSPQLTELLTRYGDVLTIWFDTPSQIRPDQAEQLKKLVRKHQPACLVNSRLSYDIETDYMSMGDNEIPCSGADAPWETAMTTASSWGYRRDAEYIKWEDMLDRLLDVASRGGNLLLNVGPDAEGVIPVKAQRQLKKLGEWLSVNGRAVYGTEKSPFAVPADWCRITRRGRKLFLILNDSPARTLILTGLRSNVLRGKWLDTGAAVAFEQTHDPARDSHRLILHAGSMAARFRVIQLEVEGQIEVSDRLGPDGGGKVVLPAALAEVISISGNRGLHITSGGVTEGWTDARDRLQWQFYTESAGWYDLTLTLKTGFWKKWDWGHELSIELDEQLFELTLTDDGRRPTMYEERIVPAARVWLNAGRHILTVAPEALTGDEMAGLTMTGVSLTPPAALR